MSSIFKHLRTCAFVSLSCLSQQASAIYIDLNFSGTLSNSQKALFTQAEQFWKTTLTDYQPSVNASLLSNIVINAEGTAIDGVGGTLGSAGPTFGWTIGGYVLVSDKIYKLIIIDSLLFSRSHMSSQLLTQIA